MEEWSAGASDWRGAGVGQRRNWQEWSSAPEAVSFAAQHSITPLLQHSITPNTPLLQHPVSGVRLCSAPVNVVRSWPDSGDVGFGGLLNLTYAVASYIRCGRHDRERRILDSRRGSGIA
jgi:hypothetical protein